MVSIGRQTRDNTYRPNPEEMPPIDWRALQRFDMGAASDPRYNTVDQLSPNATLRDRLANTISPAAQKIGMNVQASEGLGTGVGVGAEILRDTRAQDVLPGVSEASSAYNAVQDFGKGNYLAAGLGLAGAIPFASEGGNILKQAGRKALKETGENVGENILKQSGIKAYHGTPHSFERFDFSKIGTGEGAQAYGHGGYFAENEGVAKGYRDALAPHDTTFEGKPLTTAQDYWATHDALEQTDWRQAKALDYFSKQQGTVEERMREVRNWYRDQPEMMAAIDALEPKLGTKSQGSMYEVNINADPEHMLDWDKPLSEQHSILQQAITNAANASEPRGPLAKAINQNLRSGNLNLTGEQAYTGIGGLSGGAEKVAASEALKNAGVPGIRYLDAGSRGNVDTNEIRGTISMLETAVRKTPQDEYLAGQLASAKQKLQQAEAGGSRNFVVFDDKLIDIVRKYGLAGAVGAGIISAEMGQQMQEQGIL